MRNLTLFLFFIPFLISCEKIIDIDLNDSAPQTVVEAAFCVQDSVHLLFFSASGNYSNAAGLGPLSGAAISIVDGNGQMASFTELASGIYQLSDFIFVTGTTYTLSVNNENETIEAKSTVAPKVQIDSIYFGESTFGGPGGGPGGGQNQNPTYVVHVVFSDPAGESNFYRARMTVNDTLRQGISVTDDVRNEGNSIDFQFFGNPVRTGDSVSVQLWSIDRSGYDYFNTLGEILNSNPFTSATPFNPITNLSSGLGHFTVYHRHHSATVVVP